MPKTPRLREWRARAALSQEELRDLSGVSRATIADLEAGKRGAQPRTIRKLAEALDVEPDDLYGGPESPLGQAPPSPEQPPLNGFEEERRAAWEDAVKDARQLRETGRDRLDQLLAAWHASEDRRDLEAILHLLDEALRVQYELFREGPSGTFGPEEHREFRAAGYFYSELVTVVKRSGIPVRGGEADLIYSTPDEEPEPHDEEPKPHRVDEAA